MVRCVAGGGPAAAHFSCLAKKSKQKKATAKPQPLRVSRLCKAKNGKRTKLAALKQRPLLFPFFAPHKRQRLSGTPIQPLCFTEAAHCREIGKAVAFAFDLPALGVAKASDCQTGSTAQTCLSEASWFATPAGDRLAWVPAQRATTVAVAFLCLLSLAKQRK